MTAPVEHQHPGAEPSNVEQAGGATPSGPIDRLGDAAVAWDDFWFGDVSGAVVALFRTLLGLVNLYWFATMIRGVNWFFGDDSVDPEVAYLNGRWGLFNWFDAELMIWPVIVVSLVASIALLVGRAVVPAAVWLAVAVMSLYNGNVYLWNSGDDLLRVINVIFALGGLAAGSRAVSSALLPRGLEWDRVPGLGMRLAQIQLTVIYVTTVIDKIPGEMWRNGTAVGSALKIENLARLPVPAFVVENPLVNNLMTWASLGLEFSLPFLLWNRSTRRFGVIAGIALHLGIEYAILVGVFSWAMIVLYVAFMDGEWLEKSLRRFGERFGLGAATSQSAEQDDAIRPL